MGRQLIFCVESDSDSKTDYIYIKNTIEHFYSIDNSKIRLSPIYMGSKWKYNQRKIELKIASLSKMYNSAFPDNETAVFICVDCDDYDTRQEDSVFLNDLEKYCAKNHYNMIWFCKEIESVFWGKQVDDTSKVRFAESFAKTGKVRQIDRKKLCAKNYKDKYSNICYVLDDYLI